MKTLKVEAVYPMAFGPVQFEEQRTGPWSNQRLILSGTRGPLQSGVKKFDAD